MVREENLLFTSATVWSKSHSRDWVTGWMMQNINYDLHVMAADQDASRLAIHLVLLIDKLMHVI